MQAVNERSPRARAQGSLEKRITKKVEKLLKNLLTNSRECDIILGRLSAGLASGKKRLKEVLEKNLKNF